MIYTIAFIILIGLLVFVHELGHFLMGKLFKVRIEAFSIGFGKVLLHKKVGDTDYRISAIPLGGYVKFFGDDEKEGKVDPKMKHLTLQGQPVGKRALIVAGGPVFNFIFAGLLFMLVYIIGEPNIAPVLGYVEADSSAYRSGLKIDDRILAVNGKKVQTWSKMDERISQAGEDMLDKDPKAYANNRMNVTLTVQRGSEQIEITAQLTEELSRNKFGEMVHKPQISGIAPSKRSPLVGVGDPESAAFKAGFKTGDLVAQIDGKEIKTWDEMETALALASSGKTPAKVSIKREKEELQLSLPTASGNRKVYAQTNSMANSLGLYPSELFVSAFVNEDSPAVKAGMQVGDRMVAVNGKVLRGFQTLQQLVDRAGRNDQELNMTVERNGKLIPLNISPRLHKVGDEELGQKEKRFLLGVQTYFYVGPFVEHTIVIRNPIELIWESIVKTLAWIWITLVGLIKLFTGAVSLKAIGGPLMIGKVAGDSLHMGVVYFFRIMAIISINLGIINLFPIPVLDGGHLLFFAYEAVRGKPLKEKQMLIAQQVGFYLLIALIVLSFYNDLLKYGSSIIGKFMGIFS